MKIYSMITEVKLKLFLINVIPVLELMKPFSPEIVLFYN